MNTQRARRTSVTGLVGLMVLALGGAALAAPPRDVSAALTPVREKAGVPALGAAAIRAGEVTAIGVTGTRRAAGSEAVAQADLWHLGSCTKAMTATLVARLVEQGVMKWETTIADAFPDLKATMQPAWHNVTVQQLLQNRGGVPNDLTVGGLWGRLWSHVGTPTEARRALLVGVTAHPPVNEPGTVVLYSNGGFAIAGHMAEAITGVSWEDLMRRELFGPLGMTTAGFGAPGTAGGGAAVDQPRGHKKDGDAVEPGPGADNPVAIGPAGIVHASLEDWSKFVAVHLKGARGEDTGYLKPESFTKMHTPGGGSPVGYAMGWNVATRTWAKGQAPGDTGRVLSHAGSNTMWYCVAWIAPERDFAAISTANKADSEACDRAVQVMMKEALK